jgi:hypothetical protein
MGVELGFLRKRTRIEGVLRGVSGPKREETGENCIMRSFMICIIHRILIAIYLCVVYLTTL